MSFKERPKHPAGILGRWWERPIPGLLVVVLAMAGALVGCGERVTRAEFEVIRSEAESTKAELEDLEKRTAEEISDLEKELGEESGARDMLESEVEVLKQQLEQTGKELEDVKAEYEDYQKRYRIGVRESAKGRTFEKVVLSGEKDEEFTGVTVVELNAARVRIQHSGGVVALPLASLSPELQEELAFDLEDAVEFMEAEELASQPVVMTQEEKNQALREKFAKERMANLASWKKAYAEAEEVAKQLAAVAAKQKAVLTALNRYYAYDRNPKGPQLENVNRLKKMRSVLDRQYAELKRKHRQLLK